MMKVLVRKNSLLVSPNGLMKQGEQGQSLLTLVLIQ
uniref:Uncharacterized protein n=1 Tax=Rhizophora mucronata TaxID=61149 RepID=A0A2P2Q8P7_RHIMU